MTSARRSKHTSDHPLPGDPDREEIVARMIRVDQAGEYGAKRIYEGQLAILGGSDDEPVLREMLNQELEHLERFDQLLAERQVRPTILQPLWHAAGFALGVGTALLGRETAMACTVAVEEVIEEHYTEQAEQLGDDEKELRSVIEAFRDDERHHREIGLKEGAEQAPAFPVLKGAVKAGSKLAIWLSTRI
jgi:ubiquinone biosynthesis monooxygenase Coq7